MLCRGIFVTPSRASAAPDATSVGAKDVHGGVMITERVVRDPLQCVDRTKADFRLRITELLDCLRVSIRELALAGYLERSVSASGDKKRD
jgi:hypothetical protein